MTKLAPVAKQNTSGFEGLLHRINTLLLGVPVFVKVMGIALGVAVVLGAGMLWQIHRTWHAHLMRNLEEQGRRVAGQVAVHFAGLIPADAGSNVVAELRHSLTESTEVAYLVLEDRRGIILAEARQPGVVWAPERIKEITTDMAAGTYRLRVGMTADRVDQEVAWLTRRLARTTGFIALLGMVAAWWLTRIFSHPIEELVNLTRAVKAGDYHAKAPVRARDEVGELAASFNEMTASLAQKEAGRQNLLRQVIRAGEEERKRIARELHDQTGQVLTSQIAALSALENQSGDDKTRRRLGELRQQVEQTLAGVHDLAVTLRPSVLDDVGLIAALQRHCRLFEQRFGVRTTCLDLDLGSQRLPAEVELTIYRVVQEALTNGVRHGRAQHLQALVQHTGRRVLVVIRDNGCGFDSRQWQQRCVEGNHLGLLGIEERVNLVGGSFCVDSYPGKGATVFADIPLPEAA